MRPTAVFPSPSRRKFLTGGLAVGGVILTSDLLAACGNSTSPAAAGTKPARGGILKIATDASPLGLDPNVSTAFSTWQIIDLIYESLLNLQEDGTLTPAIAQSYSQPDATTYIFKLRPGVKFSNGRTVTSADVQYSYERILDPKTASPWASIFDVIDRIETPDVQTVEFYLKTPFAPFLTYSGFSPYTPIIAKEEVERYGNLTDHALGTGPFVLSSYNPDTDITLTRNRYYWDPPYPYLDALNILVITDQTTRLAAVRSGEVDLTWVGDPRTKQLLGKAPNLIVAHPSLATGEEGLVFNQTRKPFSDVNVRRAVSCGINRKAIIDLVLDGQGQVGSKIPPGDRPYGYDGPASGLPYNTYDPSLAKKLLAEAGYPHGFSTTLQVSSLYPNDVPTAEVIADQLADVGIKVSIVQKDWDTVLSEYVATTYSGMSMIGLVWQPDPDADVDDIWSSTSPINLGKFKDPAVDKLIQEGRTETNIQKRVQIYDALTQRVAEQAYMVFPYDTFGGFVIYDDQVHGFTVTNSGLYGNSLKETWLGKQ